LLGSPPSGFQPSEQGRHRLLAAGEVPDGGRQLAGRERGGAPLLAGADRGRRLERGILGEDGPLHPLQLGARLDAELLDEDRPRLPVER
jgi:hypothetical protein